MQHKKFLSWLVVVSLMLGMVGPARLLPAQKVQAQDVHALAVTLDGTVSTNTAGSGTSINITHTTGTGTNRLMLVGVSWNSNTAATSITSVVFTPTGGGDALTLSQVISRKYASNMRYAAIWYSPTEPPPNTPGTVTVTFSANVSSGIVAGAANLAGVDLTTPLGIPNGADASSSTVSVTLSGLKGDELVFDTVFRGGTSSDLTAGPGQTPLWNLFVSPARGGASTEQVAGSSVEMSWTMTTSGIWVSVAVPILPTCTAGRFTLTAGNDGHGTVTVTPGGGSYCSGTTVRLTPVPTSGYLFSGWVGENASEIVNTAGVYTLLMDGPKSVTANFAAQSCADVSLNAAKDTYLSAANTTYNYGATTSLQADWTTGTARRTALMLWNTGGIASTAVVNSASLVLQVTDASTVDFALYEVAAGWEEGDLDGAASSAGAPGANWGYRNYEGGIAWGAAGASSTTGTMDRGITDLWNATGTSFNSTGSKTVALNAEGVAVVQRWIAGGTNFGTIIQNYSSGTANALVFDSSEGATPPALSINWCLPNNTAPSQPTLVAPAPSGVTGVSTSPTLEVIASDTDNNVVDVTFWGRAVGAGAWDNRGTVYGVASGSNVPLAWPGLAAGTQYEWYVTIDDGPALTTGPTWTFTTAGGTTGTIIVEKQTTPDGLTDKFTFTGTAAGEIADGQQIVVSSLAPGTYYSEEDIAAGWLLTNIVCDDSNSGGDLEDREATFQLEAGETVKCTFYNVLQLDFGDAPDSYKTLLASDGARHTTASVYLGNSRDDESNGQPSTLADGDDLNVTDDEDGVTLAASYAPGDTAASVTVLTYFSNVKLDAWIDFNDNGTFEHPAEHLWGGTSQALPAGVATPLTFAVPADAEVGTTYARFRSSSAGSLAPSGLAANGEVEDYQVTIQAAPTCYALTLGHTGNGTTPVAAPANSTGCPAGQYTAGENISLSGATPDTGSAIIGWYGTGNDTSTADTNSLVMPASAHSAGVNYNQSCYRLTLGHTGNGTTPVATSSAVCGGDYYGYGETISLSGATPDAGWGIASWYGTSNDTSKASTNSLTMPASALSAGVNYLRLLGDVNRDGVVNSTDALIVLTVDAGLSAPGFCPMNYGDVNGDGYANSTDALIILTYDVGISVPFPVAQPAVEPVLNAQPPGCGPV